MSSLSNHASWHPLDVLDGSGLGEELRHRGLGKMRDLVTAAARAEAVACDVRGAAGLGKTRMWEEALRSAEQQGVLCVARTLVSVAEAGKRDQLMRLLIDDLAGAFPRSAAEHKQIRGLLPPKSEPVERWVAGEALRVATRAQPVLVAFDNFHLANADLRGAVATAFRTRASQPQHGLAILVTSAGDLDRGPLVGGPRDLYPLSGLSDGQVELVVADRLDAVPPDLLRALILEAKGNLHWLSDVLNSLDEVREPARMVETVLAYRPYLWGTQMLAPLSDDGECVLKVLSLLSEVQPLSVREISPIGGLSTQRTERALEEVRNYLRPIRPARWTIEHENWRLAVIREILPHDQERIRVKAVEVLADELAVALHVADLPRKTIPDELQRLEAGAALGTADQKYALLGEALRRAGRKGGMRLAVELATVCLRELDDPEAAWSVLAGRQLTLDGDGDLYARAIVQLSRALTLRENPDPEQAAALLDEGLKTVGPDLPQARRRLLQASAGNWRLPAVTLAVVAEELSVERLPSEGSTAEDARMLLAGAKHLMVSEQPAGEGGKSVLELLRRCITGGGLWETFSSRHYAELCEIQWLLLCCDAHAELVAFEKACGRHLLRGPRAGLALHHILVAHRHLVEGRLEQAQTLAQRWFTNVPASRRGLAVAVLADALIERGRISEAVGLLGDYPADSLMSEPLDNVSKWRLAMTHARTGRAMLNVERSIGWLATVGASRHDEHRFSPAFAWRVDLIRLLERFRFGRHPASDSWRAAMAKLLRDEDNAVVTRRLASKEIVDAERWGTPVARARAYRASAEVHAAEDPQESRKSREQAVELLGAADGSRPQLAALDYARSVYELARQARADAERLENQAEGLHGPKREKLKKEAKELREEVSRLACLAGSYAFEFGAAELWVRAREVNSMKGKRKTVEDDLRPPGFHGPMPAHVSPGGARCAELLGTGLTLKEVGQVLGRNPSGKERSEVREVLKARDGDVPAGGIGPGLAEVRQSEWVTFRGLQYRDFHRMRQVAQGAAHPADNPA